MPPAPGTIVPIALPGPGGKVVPDAPIAPRPARATAGALARPELSPQGDVRAESEIRVRFAEPMVAVAAVGPAATPPATITPAIAGAWRWLDTRVAVFTPSAPRLPQATAFTVTVAAGTRALSGATLADATTATFTTASPMIASTFPRGVLRPDSAIEVTFDQRVDPAAIARFLRVQHGRATLPFRVVTADEAMATWRRNPSLAAELQDASAALADDHVLIAPVTAWPAGSEPRVVLAAGAPSLEGPRPTTAASAVSFAVAAPFTVRGLECGRRESPQRVAIRCPSSGGLEVRFSNPLDEHAYRSALVQLDGEPFADNSPSYDGVYLWTPPGAGRGHTVAIGGALRDIYDQPLTGARRWPFTAGPEQLWPYASAPTGLVVLDPRFTVPQWLVDAEAVASVHVELYQVAPADYFAYEAFESGARATPPGRRVVDETYPVGPRAGARLRGDLRPALSASGLGHVVAVATFAPTPGTPKDDVLGAAHAWIQVTHLGVSARLDGEQLHGWVQDLAPGRFLAPVANAAASIVVDGPAAATSSGATDAEGQVAFDLPAVADDAGARAASADSRARSRSALLEVASGDDATFAVMDGDYQRAIRKADARWYVTDDRFLYKPGEDVHLKGWVRWTTTGSNPDLDLPGASDTVAYTVTDSRGTRLAAGVARFSDQGGFDATFTLPGNANLGQAAIELTTRGQRYQHWIRLEEFRPPPFAVALDDDVTHRGATPLYAGDALELSATAGYYAGGGLTGAAVRWDATLTATTYRPPGWDGFGFAPVQPRSAGDLYYQEQPPPVTAGADGALDGASAAGLTLGVPALPLGRPAILDVDATVTDVDRMAVRASSRPILVHPASDYVGLRVSPGDASTLQAIVTDVDGDPVAGVAVDITLEGVLASELFRDDAQVVDTQRRTVTSGAAPVSWTWSPARADLVYTAVARLHDARGRENATAYRIPWWSPPAQGPSLALTPDRASYRPGDVAHLALRSSVLPAVAIVTVARRGVVELRRLELTEPSTRVDLPIAAAYVPDVHVVVDRWSARERTHAADRGPLPDHDSTEVVLPVDLDGARLTMRTRATEPLVEPGAPATFEVEVRHDDRPVANAEVALMVVDEAILALTAGTHADPLPGFYQQVDGGTTLATTLPLVQDAGSAVAEQPGVDRYSLDAEGRAGALRGGGGAGAGYGIGTGRYGTIGHGAGVGASVVTARKDFRATAVFSPTLHTDRDGKVRLTVTMPDSLTRFRIVALATADTRWFGKAEGTVVTQRKLNARAVAPRFLTQGDRFSLPVVVQNLDRAPRTIDVAVRAANLTAGGPSGRRVTVGGGQRTEVRFDFAAAARGRAVIQTIAVSGAATDASQVTLPVYAPATTEAYATYGTVDGPPAFERLEVPASIAPDVGGVDVELSSTQLQGLADAYWYLYAYPYECAEQRSARMLVTEALRDVLDAFALAGRPPRAEVDATVADDVRVLARDQLADGSWGYWPGLPADPFVSMQVLRALVADHGPAATIAKGRRYVDRQATALVDGVVREAARPVADRALANLPYRVSLAATALSALAATGADEVARAQRLHAAATALAVYPMDARARLLALVGGDPRAKAMRAELLAAIVSATHETASAATVTVDFTPAERTLLVSENRTDALALEALLREAPAHPLVTKLARGLLEGRRRGRWVSTQENLAAVTALRRYLDVEETATPDFVGRLWFGDDAYAEHGFHGRTEERAQAHVGWPALAPGSGHDLALAKDGPGRMYYRIGITYAPLQADLPPLDAGFVVRRSYRAVDDPADVRRTADGHWAIRLGARVEVTVEALNTTERHGVAVVDPIPAGFETIDAALATAGRVAADPDDDAWDHRNLRDDRSEAFTMELPAGSHRFSYTVRATTPGTFLAAPARAEEMYSPETFGRSSGVTVEIR
ncbi:MAG TPA: alpha-2-macroglobulin family protein [Kofleriaceae bacterium]|nr:alpha-2-macroglobulin family protein [Kofleriaceae bacterium]